MAFLLVLLLFIVIEVSLGFRGFSYSTGDGRALQSRLCGARKDAVPYPGYGKAKKSNRRVVKNVQKVEYEGDEEEYEEEIALEETERQSSVGGQIKLNTAERLTKVLSRAGVASRRGADDIIASKRVIVNGKLVLEPGFKVNVKKDVIVVDGERISLPDDRNTYWVAINKPKNIKV